MEFHKLHDRIKELAEDINYPCKKVDHLVFALKLSQTPGHIFFHSGFEAMGKSLLEAVNTHYLFTRGYSTEKEINEAKKIYKAKNPYANFAKDHHIWKFIYNDEHFADEVKRGSLRPKDSDAVLLERIVGAMYYDSNWEATKNWIITTLGIRELKKTGSIDSSK